jgi:hypothetical protein
MKTTFSTIESWASSIGYVVERTERGVFWYKEHYTRFYRCSSVDEAADQILSEIRESLKEAE